MSAPLDIAAAARIRALLDSSAEPAVALHGTDLAPEAWEEAEELLLGELAEEVDRGEVGRLEAYQRVYRATRRERDPSFESETEKGDAPPIAPRGTEPLDVNETMMADLGTVMAGLRNGGLPFEASQDATAPLPLPLEEDAQRGMTAPTPRTENEGADEKEPNLDETSVGGIDVKDLREALKHGR